MRVSGRAGAGAVAALVAAGAGALSAAGAAVAEERLELSGGFTPDPVVREVETAGATEAGSWVRGCPGFVAEAAPLTVALSAPWEALRFYLEGEGFAGLVLAGPDGVYRCAPVDDAGRAAIRADGVQGGEFALWPATAEPGVTATARISVSERDLGAGFSETARAPLDPDAPPAFGLHDLPADGAVTVATTLTGGSPAAVAAPDCVGEIDPSRPDLVLRLGADEPLLAVRATSSVDTTLVVRAPDGAIVCNDDSYGVNPEVAIEPAAAGDYAVWVGVYSGAGGASASVEASRERGAPADAAEATPLDPEAEPAAGRHVLPAEGGVEVALTLAGGEPASEMGAGCIGDITPARPDAVVVLQTPEPALRLGARSDEDTTLVVMDPDGAVHCNDDTGGLDPAVQIDEAPAGEYAVWVGGYSGGAGTEATFYADRGGPDGFAALPENPFAGRVLESAAEALQILQAEGHLGGALEYESMTPQGREGVVLEGVTLSDPSGENPPVGIGRITISDLDLEGLAATGQPGRFAIALADIDYSALAEAGENMPLPPLPALQGGAPLNIAASLLPDGAADRREARMSIGIEGLFALDFSAQLAWPEGEGAAPTVESAAAEAMTVELSDRGFLAAMIDAQAAEMGMERAEVVSFMLGMLAQGLGPSDPASPEAQLIDVASQALNNLDRPGLIRLGFATDEPQGLQALFEELQSGAAADGRLHYDISYEPLD